MCVCVCVQYMVDVCVCVCSRWYMCVCVHAVSGRYVCVCAVHGRCVCQVCCCTIIGYLPLMSCNFCFLICLAQPTARHSFSQEMSQGFLVLTVVQYPSERFQLLVVFVELCIHCCSQSVLQTHSTKEDNVIHECTICMIFAV